MGETTIRQPHVRELYDRMGLPREERAKLLEDMQKSLAVALSSPDEVLALHDIRRKE